MAGCGVVFLYFHFELAWESCVCVCVFSPCDPLWIMLMRNRDPGQPKRLTKEVCPAIKRCVLFSVCQTFHGLADVDLNWHLINCHYYLTLLKRGALTLGDTIKRQI